MKAKKVIFYGALGYPGEKVVGGGEAGNHKSIKVLESLGLEIACVYKPYPKKGVFRSLQYAIRLFAIVPKLFFKLMDREIVGLHVSGFYQHLIYQEFCLLLVGRILGKQLIYELRGGGVEEAYNHRTGLYRFFFKRAVLLANVVLSQGEKYTTFLERLGAKNVVFYPNFIDSRLFLKAKTQRSRIDEDVLTVNLVYFGRFSETKNIDFIIDVFDLLSHKSDLFSLELIGSGEDKYMEKIRYKIAEKGLLAQVKISPPIFGNRLFDALGDKHFFLFPTNEPREGHSNALTEAMGLGLVPICSAVGFNSEIVSMPELVIPEFVPQEFASRIWEIWTAGTWKTYSDAVKCRVHSQFTESRARSILSDVYVKLLLK